MRQVRTKDFPYPSGDGLTCAGWLADGSDGQPAPAVLVAHEAPGSYGEFGDNVRRRATLLAERGLVAMALDLYGEAHTKPLPRRIRCSPQRPG